MSALTYKGMQSTTFIMCAVTGLVGTALLILGQIDQDTWKGVIDMAIGGYVVRHASSAASEAYRDKGKQDA